MTCSAIIDIPSIVVAANIICHPYLVFASTIPLHVGDFSRRSGENFWDSLQER
jgi:hypothetical protein